VLKRSDDVSPVLRPERKGALDGAVKSGGPLAVEDVDIPDELYLPTPPDPLERKLYDVYHGIPAVVPGAWEELTETESGYLLRYEGRLYAAIPINAEAVMAQAFAAPPAPEVRPGVEVKARSKPIATEPVKV